MNNIRFLWENKFDNAVIEASTAATALPVANLVDQLRKKVWRSVGTSGVYIDVDFGAGGDYCNSIGILGDNLSYSAQVQITASDVAAGASELLDSTWDVYETIWGAGEGGAGEHGAGGVLIDDAVRQALLTDIIFYKTFAQVSARYWRITFLDADNSDGYIQAGRVYLGIYFEPQFNFGYGWQFGIKDESKVTESIGGQKWVDLKGERYTLALSLKYINNAEKYWSIIDMMRRYGIRKDIIVVLTPDGQASERLFTTLYGRFTKLPRIKQAFYGYSSVDIEFEESL